MALVTELRSGGLYVPGYVQPAIRTGPGTASIRLVPLQVGQKYDPHYDYFFHQDGISNGGNRIATLLLYLTDVEEGGETVFPNIPVPEGQTAEHYSECAMQGLAVKPRRGDAAVFWSLTTAGTLNKGVLLDPLGRLYNHCELPSVS